MCPLSSASSLLKCHQLVPGDTAECRSCGSLGPGCQGAEQWKPPAAEPEGAEAAPGPEPSGGKHSVAFPLSLLLPSCCLLAGVTFTASSPHIFCSHQRKSRKKWLQVALGSAFLPARPTDW